MLRITMVVTIDPDRAPDECLADLDGHAVEEAVAAVDAVPWLTVEGAVATDPRTPTRTEVA